MKQITMILLAVCGHNIAANAQATTSANQSAVLSLSNAIAVTFTGTGTTNGGSVTVPFVSMSDYTAGITTPVQTLKVQSNKLFNLAVSTSSSNFSYSGSATPVPVMPVAGVLGLQVTSSGTGGTVNPVFGSTYSTLSNVEQSLVTLGANGGNQTLSMQYKATPGFAYPAGTYTANVVFTTTQP